MNIIEGTIRRIDGLQQRHTSSAFLFGVVKKFGDDNAGNLTIQITYTMFVTIFPLLLLLVTILGIVLADNPSDRSRVLNSALGQFPIIGQQLGHNLHAIKRSSVFGLVFGIGGLVYGSTGLAQAGLYSMAQIWNIPSAVRPNYLTRMTRSVIFLVVLAVGLTLTTALAGFGTFGRHNIWLGALGEVLAIVLNVLLYFAVFRTLTPKQVTTRSLAPGVVIGGVAWTILQAAGGYVVGHDLKGASALYGVFGLVLGLIAWIYLAAEITLYAAEINTVLFYRLWPRGMVQPPLTDADQRSLAFQVTQNQRRPEQEVVTRFRNRPMNQDEYRERGYHEVEERSSIEWKSPEDSGKYAPTSLVDPGTSAATSGRPRTTSAQVRVVMTALIGTVVGALASIVTFWQAAILLGWSAGIACLLAWIWCAVWKLSAAETKSHANREDPSVRMSEFIVLASGVALLAAVGLALVRAGKTMGATKDYLITLGILSVALSWATVHTLFTLRYARTYYAKPAGGIDFNENDPPTYLDFAYLAMTIGMTFQVSDTNLTSKPIRRIALKHAMLSYLFGAVIVALVINVVASLLS